MQLYFILIILIKYNHLLMMSDTVCIQQAMKAFDSKTAQRDLE
jgi:hypothetical protein